MPRFAKQTALDRLVAGFDQNLVYSDVLWLHQRVHHRRGHVLGVEHPTVARLPVLLEGLLIRAHRDEIRRHVAWLDGRYFQPRARRLEPESLRECLHEELARRVDGKSGEDFPSGVRRNRDDVPPPSLHHPWQHRADAVERALAVDLDGTLPLLLADVLHHGVVHDPCTVDENLHGTELLPGAPHERVDLISVRYVSGRHDTHPAITVLETRLDLQEHLFPAGGQRHARPLRVQRPDHSGADAARSPDNNSYPVLERSRFHSQTILSQQSSRERFLRPPRAEMLTSEGRGPERTDKSSTAGGRPKAFPLPLSASAPVILRLLRLPGPEVPEELELLYDLTGALLGLLLIGLEDEVGGGGRLVGI